MVDRLTEIGGAVFRDFAKEYGLFYVRIIGMYGEDKISRTAQAAGKQYFFEQL